MSGSAEQTLEIAREFARGLKKGDVVELCGELGAGKTVFVRGMCDALGVEEISSPTFALVNEYEGVCRVFHFDAYRINAREWTECGFDEILGGDNICFVEWAQNVDLRGAIQVRIEGAGDGERKITVDNE